ncbi:MAG: glutamate-1-semialdehyde 2,1-aminomutase [Thermoplasmatales archaeon]|nr:glutamate-1-semialdehyde 2,1-aminomutase [Thermoplasmatales archaeon]
MIDQKKLRKKIHSLIPGGAHTYSRGDDQFPENAPAVLVKGKGCYVWGSDNKKYLDYGMGLRAVTIGYARPEIDNAAIREIKKGNNLTKASMTELKAAEKMLKLYPGMDMIKFAKNGSTVTTAAVKLARAYTNKKYVVRCADHPFFSYDDWFIGDTVMNRGIPEEYKKLTLNFRFNDVGSLKKVFKKYKNQIACVIMEPTTHIQPEKGFLDEVKEITHKNNAVLIFDEVSCSFRVDYATYKGYNVIPDMVTVGKGIANGYSVDALLGKKEIMKLGGIHHNQERVFLISTTFGAEMSGLGALMATIDFYKKHNVIKHIWNYGEKLRDGVNKISDELGLMDYFYITDFPPRIEYVAKDKNKKPSFELRTLFAQEMVKQKILILCITPSYSHKDKELKITLDAVRNSLEVYRKALNGNLNKYLHSAAIKPVFRKYN